VQLSDIDVVSSHVYLDDVPFEQFAFLRRHAPVFRQHVPDPLLVDEVWVVSRYDDVRAVSLDTETFSSASGTTLRAVRPARITPGSFIGLDDPEHGRLRSMVSRAFTPRVVRAFEHHYREMTVGVIEKALAQERFDFVQQISAELPLLAICELLGVPEEDRYRIAKWSNAILGAEDPDYAGSPEAMMAAVMELGAYAGRLAEERRREPREDVMSALANATGEHRLSDPELEGFTILLLAAGNETTRNNITHGLLALLDHPDQLEAVRDEPERHLDSAVEEITRWASPVNSMVRRAQRDTELGGQSIAAGDWVGMFYSSANRDEDVFADADRFDIGRSPNNHLAFGLGKHFCLGANLARIETKVMFSELLPRADLRVTGPVRRVQSSFVRGIKELPVEARRR
jgi:cholest-4-en-3-one 26-monooxygenase